MKSSLLEGMANHYGNLGLVFIDRGDLEGAEAMHRKSLAIEEKLGRLEGMASDYGNLARSVKNPRRPRRGGGDAPQVSSDRGKTWPAPGHGKRLRRPRRHSGVRGDLKAASELWSTIKNLREAGCRTA